MPKIRSVYPDICWSDSLARVEPRAERTFVRLWTHVDDEGRCEYHPLRLRSVLYQVDQRVTPDHIEEDVAELAREGCVVVYEVAGTSYLAIPRFDGAKGDGFQKPKRYVPSKLPAPPVDNGSPPPIPPPHEGEHEDTERHDDGDVGNMRPPCGEHAPPGEGEGEGDVTSLCLPAAATARPPGQRSAERDPSPAKPTPRALGTNPRARKANPRASGTNPRATGTNPLIVDPILAALADASAVDLAETPNGTKRRWRQLAAELAALGATPAEVQARAGLARLRWRDGQVTPDSLHKHWAQLAAAHPAGTLATVHPIAPDVDWLAARPRCECGMPAGHPPGCALDAGAEP